MMHEQSKGTNASWSKMIACWTRRGQNWQYRSLIAPSGARSLSRAGCGTNDF